MVSTPLVRPASSRYLFITHLSQVWNSYPAQQYFSGIFFFFHNKLKILIFAHKINISDGSCWEAFLFQNSPICSFPVAQPGWALPWWAEQMCTRYCEIGHCWWKHHRELPGTAQSRFQGLAPAEPTQSQCQNSTQGMSGAAPLQGEVLGAVISLSCLQECSICSKAFGGFPLPKVLEND